MIKVATGMLEQIEQFVKDHPKTTMGLIGGGLGALGGGLLTGPADPDETPGDRFKRRLKNALLMGGLGAGAGTLLGAGYEHLSSAVPASMPTPEENISKFGDKTKNVVKSVTSPVGTSIMGAGAGIAGSSWYDKKINGSDLRSALQQVGKDVPATQFSITDKTSVGEMRKQLRSLFRSTTFAKGTDELNALTNALKRQFGVTDNAGLLKALQSYGISTSDLEKSLDISKYTRDFAKKIKESIATAPNASETATAKALQAASKATRGFGKFVRRNKRLSLLTAIGSALGLGGGLLLNND